MAQFDFISKPYLMVDLFFIMSGFIMFHVYNSTFTTAIHKQDFVTFIRARFARIYPLHFFTLLLSVAGFYLLNEPASPINNPYAIITHLLLLHSFGIHDIFTWNIPSWSISAEWAAYTLFPLLALILGKYKKGGVLFLSLVSILLYVSILYFLARVNPIAPNLSVPHDLNVTYDFGYIRGIAGFIAGMIAYIAFQQKEMLNFFNSDVSAMIIILLTVAFFHWGVNDLWIVLCFVLLVLAIAANQKGLYKLFQFKPLQYLGDISYSIYLTHGLTMFTIAVPLLTKMGYVYKGPGSLKIPFMEGLWICSVYLLVIVIISSMTYYGIEKPCRRWINAKF